MISSLLYRLTGGLRRCGLPNLALTVAHFAWKCSPQARKDCNVTD